MTAAIGAQIALRGLWELLWSWYGVNGALLSVALYGVDGSEWMDTGWTERYKRTITLMWASLRSDGMGN